MTFAQATRPMPAADHAHARARPGASIAAVLALLLAHAPALAADVVVNVAELVTGTAEHLPIHPGTKVACGSNCRYAAVSASAMDDGYAATPGPLALGAWPVAFGTSLPGYVPVEESLGITQPPAGTTLVGLNNGVLQRSAVDYDAKPVLGGTREASVQSWKSGSGASVVSYAIRITTPIDAPKRTYLSFKAPAHERSWVHASSLGGPSGNETVYTRPERLQTRSAVDVYVDGLPVWSSEANMLVPQRYQPSNWGALFLQWGQPLPSGDVTLFLGTLPVKSVRTAVVVMRTELRVDAPGCRTRTEYGATLKSCSAQRESLTLPSSTLSSGAFLAFRPSIEVYSR